MFTQDKNAFLIQAYFIDKGQKISHEHCLFMKFHKIQSYTKNRLKLDEN